MHGIYAVVKVIKGSGAEPTCLFYKPTDHYSIYDKVMELTDNDHEIASNVASWCEIAGVGEVYEFHGGEVEIVEFE